MVHSLKKIDTTRHFFRSSLFFSISVLLVGLAYASGLFSSLPASPVGQAPGGAISVRFANMSSVSCAASIPRKFLKGFDANYAPICVPYNAPTASVTIPAVPSGYPASSPSGEMPMGKFGTYFKNLLNVCPGNGVIRGFTSQGQKICADATNRATPPIIPSLVSYSTTIAYPAKPSSEPTGGKYQAYFTNMFAATCNTDQGIQRFSSNGIPTCANIPVDAQCGASNGANYYLSSEITSPCGKGTSAGFTGAGPWPWTCNGLDTGTNVNCSANKKVDGLCGGSSNSCTAGSAWGYAAGSCGWNQTWNCNGANTGANVSCILANGDCPVNCVGSWNDNSACSLACGSGVKQQTYTITTPAANGGLSCPSANGATRWGGTSCNTGNCPINGSCNNSTAWTCSTGSAYGWVDNGCGSTKTWNCSGQFGWSNSAQCSITNAVCDLQPPTITQVKSLTDTCNSVMAVIEWYADNSTLSSTPYSWDGGASWNSSPYFIPPLDYSSTYQLNRSIYTIAANKLKVRDAAWNKYSNPADITFSTNCIVSPEYWPFTFSEATTKCASLWIWWHVPKDRDFLMWFWKCTEKPLSGGINCKYPSSFTNWNIYWSSTDITSDWVYYKEAFSPWKGWNGFESVLWSYSYSQRTGPNLSTWLYGSSWNMMLRCVKYN